MNSFIIRTLCALLLATASIYGASGQATSPGLSIKAIAEVRVRAVEDGRESFKLVPANRVVPGDEVIYTLEIRNTRGAPVPAPEVTYPVPPHTHYLADSATGPGADVSYSLDGGSSFDRPENLHVRGGDGRARLARPDEYTHIRWKMRATLQPKSVAFARFRTLVN